MPRQEEKCKVCRAMIKGVLCGFHPSNHELKGCLATNRLIHETHEFMLKDRFLEEDDDSRLPLTEDNHY